MRYGSSFSSGAIEICVMVIFSLWILLTFWIYFGSLALHTGDKAQHADTCLAELQYKTENILEDLKLI